MCFELVKITFKREKKKIEGYRHQNDFSYKNTWLEHNYFLKQDFIIVISLWFIFIPVPQRNAIRVLNL